MDARTTVPSEEFVASMRERWTTFLGNTPSAKLLELWRRMCSTFNDAICLGDQDHKWRVLQPPTGSGKTQGACLYAAMLVRRNDSIVPPVRAEPTGILIVTRTIAQADEVGKDIRSILEEHGMSPEDAARSVAVKHSDNKTSLIEMRNAAVLVICHNAYVKALSGLHEEQYGRWDNYTTWSVGLPRRLTIIDEMLSGLIEEHIVTASAVSQVIGAMKPHMRERFPHQLDALREIKRVLEEMERQVADIYRQTPAKAAVWVNKRIPVPERYRMNELLRALLAEPLDLIVDGKEDESRLFALKERFTKALRGAERILDWCYYAHVQKQSALVHSFLLSPSDMPGPVVLDATARQHPLWGLLGDRVTLPEIPEGVRNYENVTLHVTRLRGIGKHTMTKTDRGSERIPRALQDIASRLPQDSKTLIVVHKDAAHHAVVDGTEFADRFSHIHWHALDGKNQWKDYDSAVLLGLPYPNEVWATSMVAAVTGAPNQRFLEDDVLNGVRHVQRDMTRRHLAASIVQAINRVRCRKTVDVEGRCQSTDIFLALPKGGEGDAILEYVREEMPKIKVQRWDIDLDGANQKLNPGSCHPRLVEFMKHREPGSIAFNHIQQELGLTHSAKRDLQKTLREDDHPLTKQLRQMGVIYQGGGRGRSREAYLTKLADPPSVRN